MELSNHRFFALARVPLLPLIAVSVLFKNNPLTACEVDKKHFFHIHATDLSQALLMIAHTSGCVVSFKPDAVRPMRSDSIEGSLTVRDAMSQALVGSGLEIYQTRNGTLTLRKQATSKSPLAEK